MCERIYNKEEIMMRIVVGYNDSGVAGRALKLAVQHAKAFDARVHLLTSFEGGAETTKEDIEQATAILENGKKMVDQAGVVCETHLLIKGCSPGEDLVNFARDNQIDEIIMGVKRKSKVGKMLFGSTAQYVILKAPCPVVTLK